MLGFLERLLSRGPKASDEKDKTAASHSRLDVRTAADQDRNDFEVESERLRSSNGMIPPSGGPG